MHKYSWLPSICLHINSLIHTSLSLLPQQCSVCILLLFFLLFRLKGLNAAEVLIYQLIEKEKNMGIWIRDLRRKSNLPQQQIPKILKVLMTRKLIKCEKSVEVSVMT